MIQVEALETIKSDGHVCQTGDRVTLANDVAARWCGAGWAKAIKGELKTGERRVVKAVLEPATAAHGHAAESLEVTTNG